MMKILDCNYEKEKIISLLEKRQLELSDVQNAVLKIISDIRRNGDKALLKYSKLYDKVGIKYKLQCIPQSESKKAYEKLDKEIKDYLKIATKNIEKFHKAQLQKNISVKMDDGVKLVQRIMPLERVGVYVPGGLATYPSTVLMNVIPAQIAGVKEIVMVSPPWNGVNINSTTLAVAYFLGIKEIYPIGGAQAIAALSFGTEMIRKVDKIVGPGNKYVQMAKKLLFGLIDIDAIAGPSEVLIIADDSANPEYVAADLLSQAEHDPDAGSILITNCKKFAMSVKKEIERQTVKAPRKEIIKASLRSNGLIIITKTIDEAIELANIKAPEHLEIICRDDTKKVTKIKNAGAIFVGEYSTEPVGDYIAGTNHILPTNGSARFFSPLSVDDFMKKNNIIYYTKKALMKNGKHVINIAENEGLFAHSNAIKLRLKDYD